MSWLKKILVIAAVLTTLFLVTQIPWQQSESLHQWLVDHQDVSADEVPVTDSGNVDFLRLVNDRLSKDVTVANNVIVDLYQILPKSGDDAVWVNDAFIELLGDPKKDPSCLYHSFSSLRQRMEAESNSESLDAAKLDDQYEQCLERPWRSDEFPEFNTWLESNKKALDKMVAASTKPYYYHPLVTGDDEQVPMIGALLSHAQQMREIARSLNMRAMNRLAENRVDECLSDLAAIRRLGFKTRQGATLVEQLIGIAIVGMAFDSESQVLSSGKLTSAQCKDYQRVIAETTTRGTLADCVKNGERLMMMDSIQCLANGNQDVFGLVGAHNETYLNIPTTLRSFVDWKEATVVCDHFYQKLIDAAQIEDDLERQMALQTLETELSTSEQQLRKPFTLAVRLLSGARSRGRATGEILSGMLAPAFQQVDAANTRSKLQEISIVGFEIEKYRIAHGNLPESLDQLPTEIVSPLLKDRFTGNPIKYFKTDNGYRLYSVGRDGADQQVDANGQLIQHDPDTHVDDIVIKVELSGSLAR